MDNEPCVRQLLYNVHKKLQHVHECAHAEMNLIVGPLQLISSVSTRFLLLHLDCAREQAISTIGLIRILDSLSLSYCARD